MATLCKDPPPPSAVQDGCSALLPYDLGVSETSLLKTEPTKQQKAQSKSATLAKQGPWHAQQVIRR